MNCKYVIPAAACCLLLLTVISGLAAADTELERKVDSLFVIASSGEVKYRDMVEPAKDSIAAIGADAVPILVDKFTTKSARERWTIIKILEKIGSPARRDKVRHGSETPQWIGGTESLLGAGGYR